MNVQQKERIVSADPTLFYETKEFDWLIIDQFNHLTQRANKDPVFSFERKGPLESLEWWCFLDFDSIYVFGKAHCKKKAKAAAIIHWFKMCMSRRNDVGGAAGVGQLQGNMENVDDKGEVVVTLDPANNTILTEGHGTTYSKAATLVGIHTGYVPGGPHSFEYLQDRWIDLSPIEWLTSSPRGQILKTYILPLDVYNWNVDSPVAPLVRMFELWRPNMTVKVLCNSTQFHSGTLVCGARYITEAVQAEEIVTGRQVQQMNCAYIQASTSNEAEVEIDYMYPLDWMPTSDTTAANGNTLAAFYIAVVNKLGIGDQGSTTIPIQVMVKFSTRTSQTEFATMRVVREKLGFLENVRGNMDVVAGLAGTVGAVAGSVEAVASGIESMLKGPKSNNEDRPVNPHDTPVVYTVPTFNTALGNGAQNVHVLRLSKDYRSPSAASKVPIIDNSFTFSKVCGIFSGFSSFTWTTDQKRFTSIAEFVVSPIQWSADNVSDRLYPPITEISSHFSLFEGDIGFKFIFGASMQHSGRLAFIYLPSPKDTVGPLNWASFPYSLFDLKNQLVTTIVPPQVAYTQLKPIMWDSAKQEQDDYFYSYGKIVVFVINELRVLDSIAKQVDVEVQIGGMPNYKLKVPKNSFINPKSTVSLVGLRGNMENREESVTVLAPMPSKDLADVTVGEEFTMAAVCRRFETVGGPSPQDLTPGSYRLSIPVNFGYPFSINSTGWNLDFLSALATGFRFGKGSLNFILDLNSTETVSVIVYHNPNDIAVVGDAHWINYENDDEYGFMGTAKQLWNTRGNTMIPISVPWYSFANFLSNGYFDYAKAGTFSPSYRNNGTLNVLLDITKTTRVSLNLYRALGDDGELFCFQGFPLRRKPSQEKYLSVAGPVGDRPVPVQPPTRDLLCSYMWPKDNSEDGPDFFRVWMWNSVTGVWDRQYVTYNNDRQFARTYFYKNDSLMITDMDTTPPSIAPKKATARCIFRTWNMQFFSQKDNASPWVDGQVVANGAIFEIPQDITEGGGIWFALTKKTSLQSRVIPPEPPRVVHFMDDIYRTQLDELNLQGNMDTSRTSDGEREFVPVKELFARVKAHDKDFRLKKSWYDDAYIVNKARCHLARLAKLEKNLIFCDDEQLIGNMDRIRGIANTISTSVSNAVNMPNRVNEAADTITQTSQQLNSMLTDLQQVDGNVDPNSIGWFSFILNAITSSMQSVVRSIFNDLKLLIANCIIYIFNLWTTTQNLIRISSFVGLLINGGALFSSNLAAAYDSLKNFFYNRFSGNVDLLPDLENEDSAIKEGMSWFSFLLPAITASLGFKALYAKQGTKAFFSYLKDTIRCSNDMHLFFSRNFEFIRKYAYWVIGMENPHLQNIAVIKEKKEEMLEWGKQVMDLTQGHIRDRVFASTGLQKHLDILYRQGVQYSEVIRNKHLDSSKFNAIFKKIADLHFAVGQRVGLGNLVKEPCVTWLYGPSGVGKSNVAKALAGRILRDFGVTYDGDFAFVRNATRYWNGWADQPCVIYDDAFQNRSADALSQEVTEMFSICSIAEYNPELAAIDDKNRIVNPELVMYCSNTGYPSINVVHTDLALLRRRDALIEVQLTDELLNQGVQFASDHRIPNDVLMNYRHLKFRMHDPVNAQAQVGEWMNYEQLVVALSTRYTFLRQRRRQAAASRQQQGLMLSASAYAMSLSGPDMQRATSAVQETLPTLTEVINARTEQVRQDILTDVTGVRQQPARPTRPQSAPLVPNCDMCSFMHDPDFLHQVAVCPLPLPQEGTHMPDVFCVCSLLPEFGDWCGFNRSYLIDLQPIIMMPQEERERHENLLIRNMFFPYERPFTQSHRYIQIRMNEHCSETCLSQNLQQRMRDFWEVFQRRGGTQEDYEQMVASYFNDTNNQAYVARYAQMQEDARSRAISAFQVEIESNISDDVTLPPVPERNVPLVNLPPSTPGVAPAAPPTTPITPIAAPRRSPRSVWWYFSKGTLLLVCLATVVIIFYTIYKSFKFLKNWWKNGGSASAVLLHQLKMGCIRLLSLVTFMASYNALVGNILSSGDVTTARVSASRLTVTTNTVRGNADEDSGSEEDDPDDDDEPVSDNGTILEERIQKNTLTVKIYTTHKTIPDKTDDEIPVGEGNPVAVEVKILSTLNFFMLGGRIGVCPFHFAHGIAELVEKNPKAKCEIISRASGKPVRIPMDVSNLVFHRVGDLDLAWVEFPPRVPNYKKIAGMVATAADHERFKCNAKIVNGYCTRLKRCEVASVKVKRVCARTSYSGIDDIYLLGYSYPWAGKGRCSAVVVDAKRHQIVGLHVSGDMSDSTGYCVVLDRDVVTKIVTKKDMEVEDVEEDVKAEGDPKMSPNGCCAYVTRVVPKMELRPVTKTKIRESKISGAICPPQRLPAQLWHPGEVRRGYGPLKVGVEKQLNPAIPFPQRVVDEAGSFLRDKVLQFSVPVSQTVHRVRSIDSAILGMEGIRFMEPMKLNTSAGWPLCCNVNRTAKKHYVDIDYGKRTVKLRPELEELYNHAHTLRLERIVPFTVYADFGKDERLKPGKDMRLINGSPFHHTIEWRRYCLDAFAAIQNAHLDIGSAIGMNPYGFGFERLAQRLLEKGTFIVTGDYTAFGPTIQPEFIFKIRDIIKAWYNRYAYMDLECDNVIDCLFEELVNCNHIAGDLIYTTYSGCPSGNPYTAIINTLSNLLYLYCSWLLIFQGTRLATLCALEKYVYICCYGDDFVGSTNQVIANMWNTQTISLCFAEYGIKFTDASKSSVIIPYTKIEEAEFLKNTFRLHPQRNIFVACLRSTVVEDIVNWVREPCPNEEEHLQQVSLQVARFASLHGPQYYRQCTDKLRLALNNIGVYAPFPSWTYYDSLFDDELEELPWMDEEIWSSASAFQKLA